MRSSRRRSASLIRFVGVLVAYFVVVMSTLKIVPGAWVYEGRLALTAAVILAEIMAVSFIILTFYLLIEYALGREFKKLNPFIVAISVFIAVMLADWLLDGFSADVFAKVIITVVIVFLFCVISRRKR